MRASPTLPSSSVATHCPPLRQTAGNVAEKLNRLAAPAPSRVPCHPDGWGWGREGGQVGGTSPPLLGEHLLAAVSDLEGLPCCLPVFLIFIECTWNIW